jgi:BlaI family penicillinase repressor
MQVLWERGQATAREVTEGLNGSESISHSTVQTLLRQLEKKEAITHDVEQGAYGIRTFIYRPLVQPEKIRRHATRELVDRVFAGSPGGLVAYLLQHERIPRKDLERIQRLINVTRKVPRK